MNKCLITSCSNRYFPSVLNLIGSIKTNYPNHPKIYVYNLGLFFSFKNELEKISNVQVLDMPHFCNFWRCCYTWKTYIFTIPLAELNLYIDAGNEVLGPLDEIFPLIANNNYFAVDQGIQLDKITPREYKNLFNLKDNQYKENCFAAGTFGFKENSNMDDILKNIFEAGLAGLTLGFSQIEKQRNRGKNKNIFKRDCEIFRHDQTILNLIMREKLKDITLSPRKKYCNIQNEKEGVLIRNIGLRYTKLEYANKIIGNNKKIILNTFLLFKRSVLKIKKILKPMKKYIHIKKN